MLLLNILKIMFKASKVIGLIYCSTKLGENEESKILSVIDNFTKARQLLSSLKNQDLLKQIKDIKSTSQEQDVSFKEYVYAFKKVLQSCSEFLNLLEDRGIIVAVNELNTNEEILKRLELAYKNLNSIIHLELRFYYMKIRRKLEKFMSKKEDVKDCLSENLRQIFVCFCNILFKFNIMRETVLEYVERQN